MDFSELTGKTLQNIEVLEERIVFTLNDGTSYASYHMQECCESVVISEVIGDPKTVLGSPIFEAEQLEDSESNPPVYPDHWTWTKQRLRAATGEVAFIWLGESNGYYGETPYFGLTHEGA